MLFLVSIDGCDAPSSRIAASSAASAAEQYALADVGGWSSGSYRGGDAVAVVTDERGIESVCLLEGGRATFAAWYLRG